MISLMREMFFLNVKEGLIAELIFYFVKTKDKFFLYGEFM